MGSDLKAWLGFFEPAGDATRARSPDEAGGARRLPRIAVEISGGVVQNVICDDPRLAGLSVTVIDYDVEGSSPDELVAIPQDDGRQEPALKNHVFALDCDPAYAARISAAVQPSTEPDRAIHQEGDRHG